MNRKLNLLLIIIIIILFILSFLKQDILIRSIISSTMIFYYHVFPVMLFSIFINNLLLNYNFPFYLSKLFKTDLYYIFIMSLLSGSPANYVIINEYLNKQLITNKEASLMLCFTSFNNPIFLIHYLNLILNNKILIAKCLFAIYLSNLLLFILLKRKIHNFKNKNTINNNYLLSFFNALNKTINSVINIMVIIIIFKVISDLILTKNTIFFSILKGFIEITQGLDAINLLKVTINKKAIIFLIITAFSSFSIHMQMAFILKEHNINYLYYYLSRIFLIILYIIIMLY